MKIDDASGVQLSYITHFYNNRNQAQRVISMLSKLPHEIRDIIEVIVVDDGSQPYGPIDFAGLNAKYVRFVEDIPWNQAGARNLGFTLSAGKLLLFTDIDHTLDENGFRQVLQMSHSITDKDMYRFGRRLIDSLEPIHSHVNTFLVTRSGFNAIGGYDIEFTGHYGHEDTFLEFVWALKGGVLTQLPTSVLLFKNAGTAGLDRSTKHNEALLQKKRQSLYVPPVPPQLPQIPWVNAHEVPEGLSF